MASILEKFESINVWKKGDQRAPHKPLLILLMLGRYQNKLDRLAKFSEIQDQLIDLIKEFGPFRKSVHPEYPFWRLQNDNIWEIKNSQQINSLTSSNDVKKSDLLDYEISGGIKENIYKQIMLDQGVFVSLVESILESHFPSSLHEDILNAVGIDLEYVWRKKSTRDPNFREFVLRAYEYKCAVCGFDVKLRGKTIALEAAHIKWHQAGGPDNERNGIALCTLHHKLFDKGAFTFNSEFEFHVSEYVHGHSGLNEWLMNFHGNTIRPPQNPDYYPENSYLNWHVREVFKGPARYVKD